MFLVERPGPVATLDEKHPATVFVLLLDFVILAQTMRVVNCVQLLASCSGNAPTDTMIIQSSVQVPET